MVIDHNFPLNRPNRPLYLVVANSTTGEGVVTPDEEEEEEEDPSCWESETPLLLLLLLEDYCDSAMEEDITWELLLLPWDSEFGHDDCDDGAEEDSKDEGSGEVNYPDG